MIEDTGLLSLRQPPVRPYPTNEEIEHTTKVALIVVAGQATSEMAVQCDAVEQMLQMIAMCLHGGLERRRTIIGRLLTQVVGLPVQHPVTPPVLKHQIDIALQIACQIAKTQSGHRVAMRCQPGVEAGRIQVQHRQVKTQLNNTLRRGDSIEPDALTRVALP
ncbi:hypothetical protein SDC9_175833 [bioreactor metagenome]|uniref:Uncharacterized protein n=1 Tax=bioreactor metagenome TaxID=1076179 RepID=A0A645GR38_9ZZZZ